MFKIFICVGLMLGINQFSIAQETINIKNSHVSYQHTQNSLNDEHYFDIVHERIEKTELNIQKKEITLATSQYIYTLYLTQEMLRGLVPEPFHGKTNDDFNNWYTQRQMNTPLLNNMVVDSNHTTIHGTLQIYQNPNSRAFTEFKVEGLRTAINLNKPQEMHNTNDFILGFNASYNNNDMEVKIFNNSSEITQKKIDEPFKKAGEAVNEATGAIMSPFFLIFCKKPCFAGD